MVAPAALATVCASLGETSRSKKTVLIRSRRTSRASSTSFDGLGLGFRIDARDRDLVQPVASG